MQKKYIEDVLLQIENEYQLGKNFVTQKRQRIRDRLSKYRNIVDQDNKIFDRMIRTIVKTWLAIHYNDKKNVSFMGRGGKVGADAKAKLIDDLAAFDYNEMGGPKKEYRHLEDIALKGVGIRVGGLWDEVIKCPEYRVVDPLCWIPDPYNDINTGPRFHGFELEIGRSELYGSGFFEIEKVKSKKEQQVDKYIDEQIHTGRTQSDIENDDYVKQQRELNDMEKNIKGNEIYSIYIHFTQIDGKKYMFTLANERKLVLQQKEIKAVREEEKKDSRKIRFPVVTTNLSPIQDDPFGESFFDILEDKQTARQMLLNLNLIKARHETLGDKFLVDRNVIKNPNDLKQDTTKTRYIWADLQRNPNPVVPIPKPQIRQDSYNMPEMLKSQAMLETNLDEGSLGVSPASGRTATENIRVQKNSNMRMLLDRKMLLLGEKEFWDVLWFRVYQEYFKDGQKKQILINSGLGKIPQTIAKDDFNTLGDVDVSIESDFEKQEKEEKIKMGFMANANVFLENAKSEFAKNHALRKLATLSGLTEEESYIMAPESYDEMNAKLDVALINRNEEAAPIEAGQDHMTYLAMYQQAHNTPAKTNAMMARRMALMQEKKLELTQAQQPQKQAAAGQNQATITSMMMQQEGQGAPSLSDTQVNG